MTTTTFRTIPAIRMLALAVKAGHKNDMPFGGDNHIVQSQQHEYILFSLAICEALSHVNYDSMQLGMGQIVDIAKEHANFVEYDMMDPKHNGIVDVNAMLASSQKAVFFERFAHLISRELKEAPTSNTNVVTGGVAAGATVTQVYQG
jgi:hypothetical protein